RGHATAGGTAGPPRSHRGRSPEERPHHSFALRREPMTQFKMTNVYVEYDEAYNLAEDPTTHQLRARGDPARVASQWERTVLEVLDNLYLNSKLSRLLFDALQKAGFNPQTGNHDRRLVIKPYTEANAKVFGVCNSLSSAEDWRGASRDRIDGNPGQAL